MTKDRVEQRLRELARRADARLAEILKSRDARSPEARAALRDKDCADAALDTFLRVGVFAYEDLAYETGAERAAANEAERREHEPVLCDCGLDGSLEEGEHEPDCPNCCEHDWQEQPGEPPVDVCSSCGTVRR